MEKELTEMDKLHFLTAGIPTIAKDYAHACDSLRNLKLDGFEIEFVHGVRLSPQNQERLIEDKKNLVFTSHAPYYINLNAKEEEKIAASINRILQTADMANHLGGYSITYHAGFYLGQDKKTVFDNIKKCHETLCEFLEKENNKIWIRPETTGKGTQWGDLDEIIELSSMFPQVLPCVDFAHIHARSGGGFNTYDDFCNIFEKIGNKLGDIALKNFHAHVAGIEYSSKGEKKHLILEESDMNYKDLLKAFKKFGVCGALVCESPNIEGDAVILKEYYESL